MNPLFAAAAEIQEVCEERRWGFCFIGGLAVLRWGEPRLTRDVDLTILARDGTEEDVVDGLLARFSARLDDARAFAIANRVVLLRAANGVPLDAALGGLDFEARTVERSSEWVIGEATLRTCCAEDLIVHKVFAGREGDWLDVSGVIRRRAGALDLPLVTDELGPLLEAKDATGDMARLDALVRDG